MHTGCRFNKPTVFSLYRTQVIAICVMEMMKMGNIAPWAGFNFKCTPAGFWASMSEVSADYYNIIYYI